MASWDLGGNVITGPIQYLGTQTNNNQPLAISTNGVERVRVDTNGNVGIGTQTPRSKLQISGLTAINEGPTPHGAWANFGSNSYFDGAWKRVDTTKAGVSLHMNPDDGAGHEFRFRREEADGSNARNLAILGSQLSYISGAAVGIGCPTPQRQLQIADDVVGLSFDLGNSPNAGVLRFGDNTGWRLHFGRSREAAKPAPLNSGTVGLLMTIQDNGNVGIGTTGPQGNLHVAKSNNSASVKFGDDKDSASNGLNGLGFVTWTDGNNYIDSKTNSSGYTFFRTGQGTETGGQRTWMTVQASNGQVNVPGNLIITGNVNASGVTGIAPPGSGSYTAGVHGISDAGWGVRGESNSYFGVVGEVGANGEAGVFGSSNNARAAGVIGYNTNPHGVAGVFFGNVHVTGTLQKDGGGFHIDHPLDPQNQYLNHSFVESSDMKNLYDGIAVLDDSGQATVTLPDWFDTLNENLRYQLTPIGAPAPQLHLAEEIAHGTFRIAGGSPRQRISWQVTGSRKDPWAKANRLSVEEPKPAVERGHYLHPELFGADQALSFMAARFPKMARGGR